MDEDKVRLVRFAFACSILGVVVAALGVAWMRATHAKGWGGTAFMSGLLIFFLLFAIVMGVALWRTRN